MRKCWNHCPEDRPSFRMLKEQLLSVSQGLLADWLSLLHCTLSSSTVPPKSPNSSRCNPPCPPAPTSPIRASTSPETCIFCASYSSGHPWIEICRAIQATRHKWGHPHLHVNYCFKLFKSAWTCISAALGCAMCLYRPAYECVFDIPWWQPTKNYASLSGFMFRHCQNFFFM